MPARIQLKRTKGWRMPPNTVKVDRTTRFGNPFPLTAARSRSDALAAFADYLEHRLAEEPRFLDPPAGARSVNLAMQTFCLKQQTGPEPPKIRHRRSFVRAESR